MVDSSQDYFDDILSRIHAIRRSERSYWQKVIDIYATSVDYQDDAHITREFFRDVQNKFHYAIHGRTAAQLIIDRADATKPNMGLTHWNNAPAGPIRKSDVSVAKNYLNEEELRLLDLIVDQYLSFAELQAIQHEPMRMADWLRKLHDFLRLNDREVLVEGESVSHDLAREIAEKQYEVWRGRDSRTQRHRGRVEGNGSETV